MSNTDEEKNTQHTEEIEQTENTTGDDTQSDDSPTQPKDAVTELKEQVESEKNRRLSYHKRDLFCDCRRRSPCGPKGTGADARQKIQGEAVVGNVNVTPIYSLQLRAQIAGTPTNR